MTKCVANILFSNDARHGGTVVAAIELAAHCHQSVGQYFISGGLNEAHGYDVPDSIVFRSTRWINRFGISFMPFLHKELDLVKPRLGAIHIHGVWNMYNLQAIRWASRNSIPVVWTTHGELAPRSVSRKRLKKSLYLKMALNAHIQGVTVLRAITDKEKRDVVDLGFDGDSIVVIPNGTVLGKQAASQRECKVRIGASPDKKTLLFASRISKEKGISELIAAFSAISQDNHEWQLIIAGSSVGAESGWLNETRRAAEKNTQIKIIGHWPSEGKATLFGAADLFILPSYSEGFSMAILEAASYGKPSAITAACNFAELVEGGGATLINHSRLVQDLNAILNTPSAQFLEMGAAARGIIEKRYTWGTVSQAMCDVYNGVMR